MIPLDIFRKKMQGCTGANYCIDYEISGIQSHVRNIIPNVSEYGEGDGNVLFRGTEAVGSASTTDCNTPEEIGAT